MKTNQDLPIVRDEVFRKIGRNLLNFQKIEQMLKYLISVGRSAGYVSELKQNMDEKRAVTHKKTMGMLVSEFIENIRQSPDESSSISEEMLKEPHLSFAFLVQEKSDFYENRVVFLNYALFDTLKFHNPAANKINISLTNEI